jgi:polyferredoxin
MLALATLPTLFPGFGNPINVIWWVLLGLKLIALLDAAFRPRALFVAADKLTKPGWVLILATFTLSQIFQGWLTFFGLIGIVAAGVYLVDARPALRQAAGRGRGGWGGIRRRRGPRPL